MEILVLLLDGLATIIFWATILISGLFFLRVILKWANVNPFSPVPYHVTRLTEPYVRPLRSQFGGRALRYDLMPLLVGVMVLVTGLFISSMLDQLAGIFSSVILASRYGGLTVRFLLSTLIILAGLLYVAAIFLRFFMPLFGVGYSNKFHRFLFAITEPLLKPLRRVFVAGMFDFSPLIAMIIVQVVTGFLASVVAGR
ncbi:MAG TPA: YggT family protein [Blastocatellia bacterium]|nr:YggT family protein [Blastocatellia bacterium]